MFNTVTISRPYAKAIFNLSIKYNNIDYWQSILMYYSLVVKNKNISNLLSGVLSYRHLAEIFIKIYKDDLNDYSKNLIFTLAYYNRLSILPDILNYFIFLRYKHESISVVNITSAIPLNSEQKTILTNIFTQKLQNKIKLNCVIDNTIISGLIIRIGNSVIDKSLKFKLMSLSNKLQS